jgi:hypothetical protein
MADEDNKDEVSRKVVYEHVSSTSTGTSATAWIIIAVIAIALIAFILTRIL